MVFHLSSSGTQLVLLSSHGHHLEDPAYRRLCSSMVPSELIMSENILFLNKVTFLDTGVEDLDIPSLRGWMGTQEFHMRFFW